MPRPALGACALALALVPSALAAPAPVSRAQVLDAIAVYERSSPVCLVPRAAPGGEAAAVAGAARAITRFALESDEVVVDLGPDALPWCDTRRGAAGLPSGGERGLLLVSYLCGSVKAQLRCGCADANPLPGWTEMLAAYRTLRLQGAGRIAEVESLLSHEADGTLTDQAKVSLVRSRERLRRAYGPPAQASGPLVAAAQP